VAGERSIAVIAASPAMYVESVIGILGASRV
jgi:hypothetical protein